MERKISLMLRVVCSAMAVFAIIGLMAVPIEASQIIYAKQDSYIYEGSPNTNYNKKGLKLSKSGGNTTEMNPFVQFKFGSTTATKVTLRLYQALSNNNGGKTNWVYGTPSWNETTITASNMPRNVWTNLTSFNVTANQKRWYDVDITTLYNSKKGQDVTFHAWVDNNFGSNGISFEDKENFHGTSNFPQLIVCDASTPTGAKATPSTICSGGSATLSATAVGGNQVWWYTGSCGGTQVGSGDQVVSPSVTTIYYVKTKDSTTGCESTNCASVTVTVLPSTVAPTSASADPETISSGQSSTLSYSGGQGAVLKWYENACGSGESIGSGNNLQVSPTETTTYYCRWEADPCDPSSCASVTVIVDDSNVDTTPPSIPTDVEAVALSADSIKITWTESTDDVEVTGYNVYRNGNKVGSIELPPYIDENLSPETTYSYTVSAYDAMNNESAQSSPPAVETTPALPVLSEIIWANQDSYISEAEPNNNFNGKGIKMSKPGGNDTEINPFVQFKFGNVAAQKATLRLYQALSNNNGGNTNWCYGTQSWNEATITANNMPRSGWTTITTSFNIAANQMRWYDLDITSLYNSNLDQKVTFHAWVGNNFGSNGMSFEDKENSHGTGNYPRIVLCNATTPTNAKATPSTICSGSSATLSATAGEGGDQVWWYTGSCGGTQVGTESGDQVVSPTITTTYYARTKDSATGCESPNCASVTVTVVQPPTAPTSASADPEVISFGQSSTLSYIGGQGGELKWYSGGCGNGESIGSGNNLQVSPTETTTYYCRWENDACDPSSCASVTVILESALVIGDAKKKADNEAVYLSEKSVTAVFSEFFYVEEGDRSSGIRIVPSVMPSGLAVGDIVSVSGKMGTSAEDERYVDAGSVTIIDTGTPLEPVGMNSKALGGADTPEYDSDTNAGQKGVEDGVGANTIGLLVKITGEVTASGDGYFYIQDGYGARDFSIFRGIRVMCPEIEKPDSGTMQSVVGISRIMKVDGRVFRSLQTRDSNDIVTYQS